MDAPQNAPPQAPHPPSRRLLPAQRAGLWAAAAILFLAWIARAPGLSLAKDPGDQVALYWLVLAANVGAVLAAAGLALGKPQLAWNGVGFFLGMSALVPLGWYAWPLATALLGAVLAWEMVRPRPPAALPVPHAACPACLPPGP